MTPSFVDRVLTAADEALRALAVVAPARRPVLGGGEPEGGASPVSARLMRVNHTGEICAQALYMGQAVFAREPQVRAALLSAAAEERDHLAWCRERLTEMNARTSLLNPLWYGGSFALGLASGAAGDRWSMGFLSETETQVEHHLDDHLNRLPIDDRRSRAVLIQMRQDEQRHGSTGRALGAAELPAAVKFGMRVASKVMTGSAYWI